MSTHNTPWPAGTPCWVDLASDNPDATRDFYTQLFGWQFDAPHAEYGGYSNARFNGRSVAAVAPKPDGPPMPSAWTTYLASDDLDATGTAITDNGGQLMVAPMDVDPYGRMAIAIDPAGAAFGIWQAKEHTGAELVNEPGGMVWNENISRDWEAAKSFYCKVFGLTADPMPNEPDLKYATLSRGNQMVGGIGELDDSTPSGVPPHWSVYFAVADADATVAKAQELGGELLREPWDAPYGRMAVLAGPEGETFAIMGIQAAGYDNSDMPPQ